jgi:hypothetical protein
LPNLSRKFIVTDLLFVFYRDSNRDVVLEHVKTHYRDNGSEQQEPAMVELSPPPPPLPFALNTAFNQYLSTVANSNNDSASNILSGNNSLTSQTHNIINLSNPGNMAAVSNQTATASTSTSVVTAVTPNQINQNQTTTNVVLERNGMTDQGSKGSFKCGHCGQVSNWKHVIQVFTNTPAF